VLAKFDHALGKNPAPPFLLIFYPPGELRDGSAIPDGNRNFATKGGGIHGRTNLSEPVDEVKLSGSVENSASKHLHNTLYGNPAAPARCPDSPARRHTGR
jgi:hypothetical protein